MGYDEYKEQMKDAGVPKNFTNWAKSYLAKGGVSHDEADIQAYYDPSLSYDENKELFKKAYPIQAQEEMEKEVSGRYGKKQLEHYEVEGYSRRGEEAKEAARTKREAAEKTPVGKAKKAYYEIKGKYDEFQRKRFEERKYKVEERMEKTREKYSVVQKERELNAMERAIKQHERESNPLLQALKGLKGIGGESPARKALFGAHGKGASAGLNPFQKALFGVKDKPRGQYITIIQHGVARRVRIPDEAQESQFATNQPKETRSMLNQILIGNGRKKGRERPSLAAQALFGAGKREKPSGMAAALFGGGRKEKKSMFAKIAFSGGRKSRLSIGGGKKIRLI